LTHEVAEDGLAGLEEGGGEDRLHFQKLACAHLVVDGKNAASEIPLGRQVLEENERVFSVWPWANIFQAGFLGLLLGHGGANEDDLGAGVYGEGHESLVAGLFEAC